MKSDTKSAIALISDERSRQIENEGYTTAHDDRHRGGELATAGACYAALGAAQSKGNMDFPPSQIHPPKLEHLTWPWEEETWKPNDDAIRNLVKGAALLVAEIERLQRCAAARPAK